MIDLIVFNVADNLYALSIDNIVRITQAGELTTMPNSHEFIDGIMSFEQNAVKVLNFRKLVGLPINEEDILNSSEKEQKMIFYENGKTVFAIKVDSIKDIAHIKEDDIMMGDENYKKNEFLDIKGVIDINGSLINVIENLRLPK